MATATVTVAFVNQPKPGKKRGSIKSTDNVYYQVNPAMLSSFAQGGQYEIVYETQEFNGMSFHVVQSAKQTVAPPPKAANGSNTYRETSAKDAKRMWETAVMRAFIQQGQVQLSEEAILEAARSIRGAANKIFDAPKPAPAEPQEPPAPPPKPTASSTTTPARGDMDDEIPF